MHDVLPNFVFVIHLCGYLDKKNLFHHFEFWAIAMLSVWLSKRALSIELN